MSNLVLGGFEVCEAFRAAIEHDEPLSAGCGHLSDDHDGPATARVTQIATRRPARRENPIRKAS